MLNVQTDAEVLAYSSRKLQAKQQLYDDLGASLSKLAAAGVLIAVTACGAWHTA